MKNPIEVINGSFAMPSRKYALPSLVAIGASALNPFKSTLPLEREDDAAANGFVLSKGRISC